MTSQKKNITVLGAGLVGSLLSIYLAKRGHAVKVFERRGDMRKEKVLAGRSINLALSDRGWRGLDGVGLVDEIKKTAIAMHKRVMHAQDGSIAEQPYGKDGQAIYSVSRGGLNCELMSLAEKQSGVELYFNERCTHVDLNSATAHFENNVSGKNISEKSDLIFGSDGAYSAARLSMQLNTDRFEYHQTFLEHGYKELNIPADENGAWRLEKNALHIWPRGGYMLIALPNMDGSFTCTLFFPFQGKHSFEALKTKEDVLKFFSEIFPDTIALMPTLADDFFANPVGSLVTVKCSPWTWKDKMCLIGDAAHAIVPFYGQGMNCGFEDCSVLNEIMNQESDWQNILSLFEQRRKPNADAIAELARMNFIEMRDLVGDKKFLLQKKIEATFSQRHPDQWMPLYSQVTFSHKPYSEALSNGLKQQRIMDEVMRMKDIEQNWNSVDVENKILSLLNQS